MFGTFEDTSDPAKFKMRYWGAAAYLQTGCEFIRSSNGAPVDLIQATQWRTELEGSHSHC